MAAVPLPRSDVYLSLLAAKALTALADLASNPLAWNDRVKMGLESGIEYCRSCRPSLAPNHQKPSGGETRGFKRRAIHSGATQAAATANATSECARVQALLRQLLLRQRKPVMAELDAAINFFSTDGC